MRAELLASALLLLPNPPSPTTTSGAPLQPPEPCCSPPSPTEAPCWGREDEEAPSCQEPCVHPARVPAPQLQEPLQDGGEEEKAEPQGPAGACRGPTAAAHQQERVLRAAAARTALGPAARQAPAVSAGRGDPWSLGHPWVLGGWGGSGGATSCVFCAGRARRECGQVARGRRGGLRCSTASSLRSPTCARWRGGCSASSATSTRASCRLSVRGWGPRGGVGAALVGL